MSLPTWWPNHPPIYDITKSYAENAEHGPFFNEEIPPRNLPDRKEWIDFLGCPVASRIGIPAGPLLNSRWIELAAQLGFDILTYKTIRSRPFAGHPLPNMLYIEPDAVNEGGPEEAVEPLAAPPKEMEALAVTNSFGMPSKAESFLLEDIARSRELLQEGQVLVVSVVGTPDSGRSFKEDFVAAAHIAKEAGAQVIEANFSCPNVTTGEGALYSSPEAVEAFASAISRTIAPLPLIIKMGALTQEAQLHDVLLAAARGGARAISGINTVKKRVFTQAGSPALGAGREYSGICGAPIREIGLRFVRTAHTLIQKELLDLVLIGVGGIVAPNHFNEYLEAGADFAQTATGMMWDPYLAARYHAGVAS